MFVNETAVLLSASALADIPLTKVGVCVCVCVCVCVSVRSVTFSFAFWMTGPSVTDDRSIGDAWKIEFEIRNIYLTLRLKYFALYQRWGTQEGVMFTHSLLHGVLVQWR